MLKSIKNAKNIKNFLCKESNALTSPFSNFFAFMVVFLYTQNILVLGILGLFVFAPAPVLMALVQDTNSTMPTFMHSIYMGINFGLSSVVVLFIGVLGDSIGLNETFMICNILGIGTILAVWFRK